MENEIKNKLDINQINKINKDKTQMENEDFNCNFKEFHFSFEDKNEINDINVLPNLPSKSENEKIISNEDNDMEEDNKEENDVFKTILDDLNKNIEINIKELENENKNFKECQEILDILKYPRSDKDIRNGISPFKPLLKPKKISLIGKVFFDIPNDDNTNNNQNNSTKNITSNVNSNCNILSGNI